MSIGAGVKQAIKEAFLWVTVVGVALGSFVFYEELSAGLSHTVQFAEDRYRDSMTTKTISHQEANAGFERRVSVRATPHGHFELKAEVNGYSIPFMADTGATVVALTYEAADQLGLNPHSLNFSGRSRTANGIAKVAPVILDRISIEGITLKNVSALVSEPGKLSTNLLGMSFIGRLNRVEMQDGRMVLVQ